MLLILVSVITTCGCESWTLNADTEQRLFEMKCLLVNLMHRWHKTNYLVSVSGKGRIHLDSYMWTLDKPTASLSASIGAVAWVAILLRILLNGYVRQTINDLAARNNKKERIVISPGYTARHSSICNALLKTH